jgi:SAM-dependent methyltransferase
MATGFDSRDAGARQHARIPAQSQSPSTLAPLAPAATAGYFDNLYALRRDPWGLADRFYERRKRDLVLATLPRARFRRAFEPGCAVGELTCGLAQRCDEVIAWDGAEAAVDQTTTAVSARMDVGRVLVECARIPRNWPADSFDLIVLSEVGYYCPDQHQLKARIKASLAANGVLLACHWRHRAPDHPVTAENVHASLGRGLRRIATHREADFLLDVWTRDGASVATSEGIV